MSALVKVPFRLSVSSPITVGGERIGLIIPSDWTAADITFLASVDGVNYYSLQDDAGTEVSIKATANRAVTLGDKRFLLMPFGYLKIRSGVLATPVVQGRASASRVYALSGDKTLTITSGVKGTVGNELAFAFDVAAVDTLSATVSDKTVTVHLANTTASKNAASAIATLLAGLTVGDIPVTGITVVGSSTYNAAPPISGVNSAAKNLLAGLDMEISVITWRE